MLKNSLARRSVFAVASISLALGILRLMSSDILVDVTVEAWFALCATTSALVIVVLSASNKRGPMVLGVVLVVFWSSLCVQELRNADSLWSFSLQLPWRFRAYCVVSIPVVAGVRGYLYHGANRSLALTIFFVTVAIGLFAWTDYVASFPQDVYPRLHSDIGVLIANILILFPMPFAIGIYLMK